MNLLVPPSSFEIHSENEHTVSRFFSDVCRLNIIIYLIVKGKLINGYNMLSGIVLHGSGKEGLWEEETRDPVSWWHAICNPLLNEVNSVIEVSNPG
jgi:hypothetical protein